ncbi:MAG: LON peptidase substrate-binding domain-containing protein, partial [Thermodesulfovibrionales bacterium]
MAELEQKDEKEIEIPDTLPVLPIRDIVVFPYMILPLFVGREMSIRSIDHALNSNRMIMLLTQKDLNIENPGPDDLFTVGTVGIIMRMLKLPDGRVKILVQGLTKARVLSFTQTEPMFMATIERLPDQKIEEISIEIEALIRT